MTTATIKGRGDAVKWQKRFNSKAPKLGDLAPDFKLFDIRGERAIRLSEMIGEKPVALIFGSFT